MDLSGYQLQYPDDAQAAAVTCQSPPPRIRVCASGIGMSSSVYSVKIGQTPYCNLLRSIFISKIREQDDSSSFIKIKYESRH